MKNLKKLMIHCRQDKWWVSIWVLDSKEIMFIMALYEVSIFHILIIKQMLEKHCQNCVIMQKRRFSHFKFCDNVGKVKIKIVFSFSLKKVSIVSWIYHMGRFYASLCGCCYHRNDSIHPHSFNIHQISNI